MDKYEEALGRAKKSYEDYKSQYDKLDDKKSNAALMIIGAISALECQFPELKENEDEKIRREIIDFIFDKTDTYEIREKSNSWLAWLEKQGEQKPTDKVEPKFHVGEWVVYDHKPYQVVELPKEGYINLGLRGNGKIEFAPSTYCRHWTIKDAKDGDVLVHNGCTFIFMGIKNGIIQALEENFLDGTNPVCFGEPDRDGDYHPATKEQRDLLSKRMKEAGYEWDAEKKVLKKIEEEYNGEDYGIDSLWHAKNILERTLGSVDGYQSDDGILEHKCAISAVKKLYEQKPAEWSEDDDSNIDYLIDFCNAQENGRNVIPTSVARKLSLWLYRLKSGEITLKKEPFVSLPNNIEKNETAIHLACEFIRHHSRKGDSIGGIDGTELVKMLKSIKDRVQPKQKHEWKPSEEQIVALRWVLTNIPYSTHKEVINGLFEQLMQL